MEISPFVEERSMDVWTDVSQAVTDAKSLLKTHKEQGRAFELASYASVIPMHNGGRAVAHVEVASIEGVHLQELVRTEVALFDNMTLVFAYLCEEMDALREIAHREYFPALAIFGTDLDPSSSSNQTKNVEAQMARSLPWLQEMHNFVDRVKKLIDNTVHQLAAQSVNDYRLPLHSVYECLARFLTTIITLDELIVSNSTMKNAWDQLYQSARTHFAGEDEKGQRDLISAIDKFMDGNNFARCVGEGFNIESDDVDAGRTIKDIQTNRTFLETMATALEHMYDELIEGQAATRNSFDYVGLCGLYVLYRNLSIGYAPDTDYYKKLWKYQENEPLCLLYGNASCIPGAFLVLHANIPRVQHKLSPKDPNAACATACTKLDASMAAIAQSLANKAFACATRLEYYFGEAAEGTMMARTDIISSKSRCQLLIDSLSIAKTCSSTLGRCINLHIVSQQRVPATILPGILRCIEALKGLANSMNRITDNLVEIFPLVLRRILSEHLPEALRRTGISLEREASRQNLTPREIDALQITRGSALLLRNLYAGTSGWTRMRAVLLRFGFETLIRGQSGLRDPTVLQKIHDCRESVELVLQLANFRQSLTSLCDCTVVLGMRDLFPALLEHAAFTPNSGYGKGLPYLLYAFQDIAVSLRHQSIVTSQANRTDSPSQLFCSVIYKTCEEVVIEPLAVAIEFDLREHVNNANLFQTPINPREPNSGKIRAAHGLLSLPDMHIGEFVISVRRSVADFLEKMFYSSITFAVHEWKSYSEMSALANAKFGLNLVDPHLPMGSLDSLHELDVLQIMRNIHIFAARYNYSMHTQVFVEKRAERGAKHLHAVTIDSIAASIRQHGTGMVNTAVNFAQKQFLGRKFGLFNQFLHDEYIKSHLASERRWFRKYKSDNHNHYPWDKADALVKKIRKLGMIDKNTSFLDKFRQLISEMGNALGYIRMIRSAAMHQASSAVAFIPDLMEQPSFEQLTRNKEDLDHDDMSVGSIEDTSDSDLGSLSASSISAAKTTDDVISNLLANFSGSINYFQLVVNVFRNGVSKVLDIDEQNGKIEPETEQTNSKRKRRTKRVDSHLRSFYMIIPSLTISFVDSLRAAKDRVDKVSRGLDAYFSDDGFAMGLAFLLSVLEQNQAFNSLHWFQSVQTFLNNERKNIQQARREASTSKEKYAELDDTALRERRINQLELEYRALYYSLSAAQIFFRGEDPYADVDPSKKIWAAAAAKEYEMAEVGTVGTKYTARTSRTFKTVANAAGAGSGV